MRDGPEFVEENGRFVESYLCSSVTIRIFASKNKRYCIMRFFGKKMLLWLAALPMTLSAQEATLQLTLDKAIELALAENPTIQVAAQSIELKKIADKEAWQNLLPGADLNGTFNHNFKIQTIVMGGQTFKMGTENNMNGGLSISLPLFAPTIYRTMKMTKDDIQVAVEQARSTRLDLIHQVTKAYYQLMLAQDSYDVLQKSVKQAEDNFNVVSAKYQQGAVSEYDKISAEVQLRNLRPSLITSENAIRITKLQLKVLMGITADVDLKINDELSNYQNVMFSRQTWGDPTDLSMNTNMRQLDLNKKLLEHTLHIQKAAFLPSLNGAFSWSYTSMANDLRINHYKWNPYVYGAISLTIPLYHAKNYTALKKTKIQLQQLAENRINTERQLSMQAQSYLDNMQASTEQVVSNKEAIAQAQKARDISDKRYQVGAGTMLELNSSEVALTQSELTYCQSIYDYLTAKADLDYVLGHADGSVNE